MTKKLFLITAVATALGILGLAGQHYFLWEQHKDEVWFHLLTHLFSLVGSAGIVGFFFEAFFRRHALEEFARQIRESFDGDPHLAAALSQDARQKRVKSTLEAQLGADIGLAAYDVLVSRYLTSEPNYRREFHYRAVLSDLSENVNLTPDLVLGKDDYYKLTMIQDFRRPFRYTRHVSIGCILTDDFNEVNYWFNQKTCIFRDTLILRDRDRELVNQVLDDVPEEEILPLISAILQVDRISVDGINLQVESAKVEPSGNSVGIQIKVPKSLAASHNKLARYEIAISGLISKEARKYPVILGEPTQDPEITLGYQTSDISRIVAAPFFTGKYPFEPRIEEPEGLHEVRVSFPRPGEDHAWVFPNSGVIFLWDRSSPKS